ncbi:hypothetical protein [Pseudorhodoplanes sp.]|uniref:hypothetical protein n=1 Tax=Pseudorhodoplanes sp. TaxID=1934341 RepID=UPI002CD40868|nr:hypothetical protein [Pseudorhodoplanes sp.]HWV54707.1 hypothetical protein [Pseudorhodoplanes sp.]
MDTFARFAFFTIVRDAVFTALAAGILMVVYSFDPPLALVIGASAIMFFAIVVLVRALFLTDERVANTEAWLVMEPHERPSGRAGLAFAHEQLELMLLMAGKNAALIAAVMFGAGLLLRWA